MTQSDTTAVGVIVGGLSAGAQADTDRLAELESQAVLLRTELLQLTIEQ